MGTFSRMSEHIGELLWKNVNDAPASNMNKAIRNVVSMALSLGISCAVTYFVFKKCSEFMDPTNKDKSRAKVHAQKLMEMIGVPDVELTDYELCIASNLVDPLTLTVSWEDIGGLDDVIDDIQESVILPYKRRDLYSDTELLQPPKGVLLYGPPGCGKTMLAKAMAKNAGARFINLQITSLLDKWYGEPQKRAEAVFSLAEKIQPCIIFIDEIDSFLRKRQSFDNEATNMMKTQFMSLWDGLLTSQHCQILVIGATNRPQDVDAAIRRRMPCQYRIAHPNCESRVKILRLILEKEQLSADVDVRGLAEQTEGMSGSDLREVCRHAATYRIRDYIRSEQADSSGESSAVNLRPMSQADLLLSLRKTAHSQPFGAGGELRDSIALE